MTEPLKLKTNEKPSIINDEFSIGLLAAPFVFGGGLAISFGLMVAGAIIGGLIGKNRMEKEAVEGKTVDKPSLSNRSALIGGMVGANLGIIGATFATLSLPFTGGLIAATAATAVVAGALGAYIGGNSGKAQQEREYTAALTQQQERTPSKSQQVFVELENEPSDSKSHSATILAERAKAASHKNELS